MISDTIQKMIGEALKAKNEVRLSTLRLLSSSLHYEKIAKGRELSPDEEQKVVAQEAKKRQDAIEAYEKVGAIDRAQKERQELSILKEFLPPELSSEELAIIVEDSITFTGAKRLADLGKVISETVRRVAGRADGRRVVEMVKQKLTL